MLEDWNAYALGVEEIDDGIIAMLSSGWWV